MSNSIMEQIVEGKLHIFFGGTVIFSSMNFTTMVINAHFCTALMIVFIL